MSPGPPLQKPPAFRGPSIPVQRPPPRKANLPPSFYPHRRRRSCCGTCCFWLCIFMVSLMLFCVCFGGFMYLWFDPELPDFDLKSFQLNKFNITKTTDGPTLDTKIAISIQFRNTNRNIRMEYDRISMFLNGPADLNMGEQSVPGFVQEKNSATTVKFTFHGNSLLSDQDAKMLADRYRTKSLILITEVRTGVGMIVGGWKTGTVRVKVICGDTTLKQIQEGTRPKCKVFVLDLIHI